MKKIVFGLTGSISSGKSTIARLFKSNILPVFNADETVHRLMRENKEMKELFLRKLPQSIVDNEIDRKVLNQMIGQGSLDVKQLEFMIYPFLETELNLFFERHFYEQILVLDVPLLFEAKWDRFCDEIVVMTADPLILQKRSLLRPNMTLEKYNILKSRQISDAEKIKKATYVIDTGRYPIEDVKIKVEQIIENARDRLRHRNNRI